MSPDKVPEDPGQGQEISVTPQEIHALFTKLLEGQSGPLRPYIEQAHEALQCGLPVALTSLAASLEHDFGPDGADAASSANVLTVLADASRIVNWRTAFGIDAGTQAQSILGFALRIIENPAGKALWIPSALRLIANCCADHPENRRSAVRLKGPLHILNLEDLKIYADLALPALYNICIDFEDTPDEDLAGIKGSSTRVNVAEKQLAGAVNAEGLCAIEILLDLFEITKDDRREILADLIDVASRSGTPVAMNDDKVEGVLTSLVAVLGIDHVLRPCEIDKVSTLPTTDSSLSTLLEKLIVSTGPSIAAHSLECRVSISNASINMLSQASSQKSLLALHALLDFIQMPYPSQGDGFSEDDEDDDTLESLTQCQNAVFRLVYEISALAEFQEQFAPESPEIRKALEMLNDHFLLSECLYVVFANATTSIFAAETFVTRYHIEVPLLDFINSAKAGIVSGVQFLVKLSVSNNSRPALVQHGAFGVIHRLVKMQSPEPNVQREAIVAARLLMKGNLRNVSTITEKDAHDITDHESFLSSVLVLFKRTDDGSTKLEIGRFAVEVYRTKFGTGENPAAGAGVSLGDLANTAAEVIAFLARHGEDGARAEGWFGLAMMTVWPSERAAVLHALMIDGMANELQKVVAAKEGPSYENTRLMLAKLQLLPVCPLQENFTIAATFTDETQKDEIPLSLRADLEAAATTAELLRPQPA